jgi:hypothetical protein
MCEIVWCISDGVCMVSMFSVSRMAFIWCFVHVAAILWPANIYEGKQLSLSVITRCSGNTLYTLGYSPCCKFCLRIINDMSNSLCIFSMFLVFGFWFFIFMKCVYFVLTCKVFVYFVYEFINFQVDLLFVCVSLIHKFALAYKTAKRLC